MADHLSVVVLFLLGKGERMWVVKKINNNVAVCLDDNHNELIVFGKGIGFRAMPYELQDLSVIERTFYGISPEYLGLIREIPKEILDISSHIVDYAASRIKADLNQNLVVTLADHINFAVGRYRKNINIKPPYVGNLAYLHETEYTIAQKALGYINRELKIKLPKEEVTSLALHLINAENAVQTSPGTLNEGEIISECIGLIEAKMGLRIDRSNFNCSRFVTHMEYLLARIRNQETLDNDNDKLLDTLKREYPAIFDCAELVHAYLRSQTGSGLGSEELSYLMLHIDRLCAREQEE